MTNISKKATDSPDYELAHTQLTNFIGQLQKKTARYFVDELLTEAERIMLVKRFAAIFMFDRFYSPYRVSHTLGMSISTTQRLYKQYDEGRYDNLLSCMTTKTRNEFLQLVEDLIMAQVSPRATHKKGITTRPVNRSSRYRFSQFPAHTLLDKNVIH
tara:strand:- start:3221 stop:3691 length:471 start_codon:yes stop_codon:yes gene_type:complete